VRRRVIYAPEAEADLLATARRIAEHNLAAAERLIDTIDDKAHLLLTAPTMGLQRDDLAPGLRSFPVGNYVIFYRVVKHGIEVARVLHGARDIPSLF
jgi:toxin ParE1/3/4